MNNRFWILNLFEVKGTMEYKEILKVGIISIAICKANKLRRKGNFSPFAVEF